jgi:NTE family protein
MESSFVLYRADPTLTPWTELCLRQADCLVVVRNADNDAPTKVPFDDRDGAERRGVPPASRARAAARGPRPQGGLHRAAARGRPLRHHHHHVRLDIPADIDRLARILTGHAVGVVMAGGGARAFTHIGVVKALRECGVPIDLVGGTSMGAIVAAGVASRWNDEELDSRFRRAFVDATIRSATTRCP